MLPWLAVWVLALGVGLLVGWLVARGLPERESRRKSQWECTLDAFCQNTFRRVRSEIGRQLYPAEGHHSAFTQLNCAWRVHELGCVDAIRFAPIRWWRGGHIAPMSVGIEGTVFYVPSDGMTTAEAFENMVSSWAPDVLPRGLPYARCISDEQSGLTLRFLATWEIETASWIIRMDAWVR